MTDTRMDGQTDIATTESVCQSVSLTSSTQKGKLVKVHLFALSLPQPSECGRQCTLNIVHAQTAAQQQSNGSYEARMSGKCGEWRD